MDKPAQNCNANSMCIDICIYVALKNNNLNLDLGYVEVIKQHPEITLVKFTVKIILPVYRN